MSSALATSAAPLYFSPFERGRPSKVYSDGALKANLPVEYAVSEIQKIWPSSGKGIGSERINDNDMRNRDIAELVETHSIGEESMDENDLVESAIESPRYSENLHLDTLVSIGTGEQKRTDTYPSAFEVGGLKEVYLSVIKAMDTEASWDELKRKTMHDTGRHYRLNIPITGRYVRLDDWSQMQRLEGLVRECYSGSSKRLNDLQIVASRLIASLLFFEPDAPGSARLQPPDRIRRIPGQIWCRLARDTHSLRALVDRISEFWTSEENSRIGRGPRVRVEVADDWKARIRTGNQHLALPVTLKTTEPESVITLGVSLRDVTLPEDSSDHGPRTRMIPISGFPILFRNLEKKVSVQ